MTFLMNFWWLGPAAREAAERALRCSLTEYEYPESEEGRRWLLDLVSTGDVVVVGYPDGRKRVLVL